MYSFRSCSCSSVHKNGGYCQEGKENDRAAENPSLEWLNALLLTNCWRQELQGSFGLWPVFAPEVLATCAAALTQRLARFEATETNDRQLPGDQSQPLSREPAVPSSQRQQIQQAGGEEGLFSIFSGTVLQAQCVGRRSLRDM